MGTEMVKHLHKPVRPEVRVVVFQLSDPGLLPPAALLHRAQCQLQRVQARLGEVGSGGGGSHVSGDSWSLRHEMNFFHFLSFQIQISESRVSGPF